MADIEKRVKDAGIPAIKVEGDSYLARDIHLYHYFTRGFDGQIYLNVQQSFKDAAAAEKYLNAYVADLEKAGFDRTNPERVGTMRQNAYFNEDLNKFVGFDFYPTDNGANINFDFVSNS